MGQVRQAHRRRLNPEAQGGELPSVAEGLVRQGGGDGVRRLAKSKEVAGEINVSLRDVRKSHSGVESTFRQVRPNSEMRLGGWGQRSNTNDFGAIRVQSEVKTELSIKSKSDQEVRTLTLVPPPWSTVCR